MMQMRIWKPTREQVRRYNANWRNRNLEKVRELARNAARRHAAWMDSLKNRPCTDCGGRFPPYVMDWDHVRGRKLVNLCQLRKMHGRRGVQQLVLREIRKCELVCSNCHRVRTHERLETKP